MHGFVLKHLYSNSFKNVKDAEKPSLHNIIINVIQNETLMLISYLKK